MQTHTHTHTHARTHTPTHTHTHTHTHEHHSHALHSSTLHSTPLHSEDRAPSRCPTGGQASACVGRSRVRSCLRASKRGVHCTRTCWQVGAGVSVRRCVCACVSECYLETRTSEGRVSARHRRKHSEGVMVQLEGGEESKEMQFRI